MTIKDIAKLAHVSISTVSKILNNKDENISDETRKRVLDVVREYQFVPYKSVREKHEVSPGTIAFVVPDITCPFFAKMTKAVEKEARKQGYNLLLCNSENSAKEEKQSLEVLAEKMLDGVIVYPIDEGNTSVLAEHKVPFVLAAYSKMQNVYLTAFDLKKAGALATLHFTEQMHCKIGFFTHKSEEKNPFLAGYKRALFQAGINYDDNYVASFTDTESGYLRLEHLFDLGITAILCEDAQAVNLVYQYARKSKVLIPEDLSVIALDSSQADCYLPPLTYIDYPYKKFATEAVGQLLGLVYKKAYVSPKQLLDPFVKEEGSSGVPYGSKGKRILVVGDLSVDYTLSIPVFPLLGGVVVANQKSISVGGRAANQSLCASQLGGNVAVIGRLGDDKEGKMIYETLHDNRINTDAVVFDKQSSTGCAYLSITSSGEGSVVVYAGANNRIDVNQLRSHLNLFDGAEYCSFHSALPPETIFYIHSVCAKKNVKMILKPIPDLPKEGKDSLLDGLFLLIPNENEMNMICPGEQGLEDKMKYFVKKGVQHVIVTLGKNGCAFLDGDTVRYYPAEQVEVVDTAGASDCFISSLMVCLSSGYPFSRAVQYANYAASLSVAHQGNFSSMTYKSMLDFRFGSLN